MHDDIRIPSDSWQPLIKLLFMRHGWPSIAPMLQHRTLISYFMLSICVSTLGLARCGKSGFVQTPGATVKVRCAHSRMSQPDAKVIVVVTFCNTHWAKIGTFCRKLENLLPRCNKHREQISPHQRKVYRRAGSNTLWLVWSHIWRQACLGWLLREESCDHVKKQSAHMHMCIPLLCHCNSSLVST